MKLCYLFPNLIGQLRIVVNRSGTGLVGLHRLKDLHAQFSAGPSEVLASVDEPLDGADEENDAESNDTVV